MSGQLAFDLGRTETFGAADFFASPSNATAYAQLIGGDWPGGRMLLIGPKGAGKTHLAHIWAGRAGAQIVAAADLAMLDLGSVSGALVIEDAGTLAGIAPAEEALFHLWNRSVPLLITAACAPRDWGLGLPDLVSRVQSMAVAVLQPPDDALLAAVLVKLFADRQVQVQPNLISFLLPRMERSVAAAARIVADLDARALRLGKPISRTLAGDVFGSEDNLDLGAGE